MGDTSLTPAERVAVSRAVEHFISWLDSSESKDSVMDEDWATLSADLRTARGKLHA